MKNTSINRYNVAVVDQSGKVGTVRYYQRGGRTYVRSAANRVDSNSNPRSDAQMKTRLMYNSRVAIYRLFKGLLRNAFQFKPRYQSDYLAYMSANANIGCYMTKDEYRNGKIILLPVKAADGELKEVKLKAANGMYVTDIAVADTSALSTVAGVSAQILDNNAGFSAGDQLTFITGNADGTSSVTVLLLDRSDNTSVSRFTDGGNGKLGFTSSDGCCVCIHSNIERQMSHSTVTLSADAQAIYETYTSPAKFVEARDSYGKAKTSILVPSKSVSVSEPEQEGDNNGNDNNGGDNGNQDPTPSEPASVQTPTINGMTPFASTSEVTLSAENGAAIHYTTDGSIPTSESQTYSAPFTLTSTTVVKAIAIKNGVSSDVASKTFTKGSNDD